MYNDLTDLSGVRIYGDNLLSPATEGYDWNDDRGWGYWRRTGKGIGIVANQFGGPLHVQIQRGDVLILDLDMSADGRAKIWQATASQLEVDELAFIDWALATRVPPDVAAK